MSWYFPPRRVSSPLQMVFSVGVDHLAVVACPFLLLHLLASGLGPMKGSKTYLSIDTFESIEHLHLLTCKKCTTVCRTQSQISNFRWNIRSSCISCVKAIAVAVAETASMQRCGPRYQVLLVVALGNNRNRCRHDFVPQLAQLWPQKGQGCFTKLLG